ncbi:hypothetical protein MRX96_005978 [Rhipicephalus microplus]
MPLVKASSEETCTKFSGNKKPRIKWRLKSRSQQDGGESQAAHNPNSRATQAVRSRPQSRAVAVAATRGIALQSDDEKVSDSEVEDIEEDDDSLSTATRLESRESASRLVGYAGFSNRLTRLEHTYKKWDKNLEAMEQRIIQRCTELMQEQMAQQL